MKRLRLLDKVSLVSGAASGIGKAISELFHQEGSCVILSDIQDEVGKQIVNHLGKGACYIHLDVSQESDWMSAGDFIEKNFGRLDILVNNAGIGGFTQTKGPHNAENFDLESWHKVMAVNADGVALGCKYAIQMMKANKKGSIVNISSRAAIYPLIVIVAVQLKNF